MVRVRLRSLTTVVADDDDHANVNVSNAVPSINALGTTIVVVSCNLGPSKGLDLKLNVRNLSIGEKSIHVDGGGSNF